MKLDQQQQAKNLYFQTDLTKTEIAETLAISRRSLHNWIRENNWEQIKNSAANIPAFLAENCYQVLGNLTGHLLSPDRIGQPATIQEVNAIYKLTLTIGKLRAKSTLNESMETLAFFADSVESKDPELAQKLQPHLEEYIAANAAKNTRQYWQSKISSLEKNTTRDTETAAKEQQLDMEDLIAWSQEESPKAAAPASGNTNSQKAAPAGRSVRDMLRGTATTGPSKNLRQHPIAA